MKIALDIHGVLSDTEFMKPAVKNLKAAGHQLIVVSGTPIKEMKIELVEKYGYDLDLFDGFFSIIDYVKEKYPEEPVWKENSGWWIKSEDIWWRSKSEICEYESVDYLIDDKVEYRQGYLMDRFMLYKKFKSYCVIMENSIK